MSIAWGLNMHHQVTLSQVEEEEEEEEEEEKKDVGGMLGRSARATTL